MSVLQLFAYRLLAVNLLRHTGILSTLRDFVYLLIQFLYVQNFWTKRRLILKLSDG